jgi:prephenate dehydratase
MLKKMAFQGEKGAYSELAAHKFYKKKAVAIPCKSFSDVFKAVSNNSVDFGIIPIENSLAGSIYENFDLLSKNKVWIFGEYKLKISHNLFINKGTKLENIVKVYSHPQAFLQCKESLSHYKKIEQRPFFDTAGSVQFIVENNMLDSAAIAGAQALDHYPVKAALRGIEDNDKNFTRFVAICKNKNQAMKIPKGSKGMKTSIVFALKNIPGALHKAMSLFAIHNIDLLKIESRPMPGSPWKYLFYLDFKGDCKNKSEKWVLDGLQQFTRHMEILGSYPRN